MNNKLSNAIIGFIVGDALGVPVEFQRREKLKNNPVTNMRGFGTYNQPKGTWSDDSTMTLCLAESLVNGLDYDDICGKFLDWVENGYMTPHDYLFDIGIATEKAITRYKKGVTPLECGGESEFDNGNGSLMRILPLVFYTFSMPLKQKFETVANVSALTHRHMRSKIACSIYVQFACELLKGYGKEKALKQTINHINDYYRQEEELEHFSRILNAKIIDLSEDDIQSTGYVVHTLEAVLWCFLNTNNYSDCVLKAVNLGDDTDTIGAITGGLAGVYYGYESIPKDWIESIVKLDLIMNVCSKFKDTYNPFFEFDKYISILKRKKNEKTHERYDADGNSYMNLFYDMGFVDFDYLETLRNYNIEENASILISAIHSANLELLIAINTYFLQQDRFCEGTIEECSKNGTFYKILNRLKLLEEL